MQFCSFVAQQLQHPVAEQIIDSHTASPFSNQCAAVATAIKDWIFFSTNSFENFGVAKTIVFVNIRKIEQCWLQWLSNIGGRYICTVLKMKFVILFFNWFCFLSNEGPVLELVLCGVSPAGCHRQSALIGKRLLGSISLTRHIWKSARMGQIIIDAINFENCWGSIQRKKCNILEKPVSGDQKDKLLPRGLKQGSL